MEIKKPYNFTAPKFGKPVKIHKEILFDEFYLVKIFV